MERLLVRWAASSVLVVTAGIVADAHAAPPGGTAPAPAPPPPAAPGGAGLPALELEAGLSWAGHGDFTDSGRSGPGVGLRAAIGVPFGLGGGLTLVPSVSAALIGFSENDQPGGEATGSLSGNMAVGLLEARLAWRRHALQPWVALGGGVGQLASTQDATTNGTALRAAAGVDLLFTPRLAVGVYGEAVALLIGDHSGWNGIGLYGALRL